MLPINDKKNRRSERNFFMKHHSKAAPVWLHGARLLFPPAATLLFLVLTEWIARGTLNADTFLQYIFPHAEAYLLAWGLLFLVWLALDWLTRFAPLATLLSALLGCLPATVDFYILQLRGEPFLPWDLMQVSEAPGVASAAGIHVQTSMILSAVLVLALTLVLLDTVAELLQYALRSDIRAAGGRA